MSLTLYAHPFAAYCWKPLIALYENATPFTYRLVEDAAAWAGLSLALGGRAPSLDTRSGQRPK
jgi:glutathione S-transferase